MPSRGFEGKSDLRRLILLFLIATLSPAANAPQTAYTPLWLYNGVWEITRKDNSQPEELVNECALIGLYFACQETVNGAPAELLIIVPAKTPGKYLTQNVNPQGRAGGRGDLEITGDKWVFSSTWDAGGRTVYYRTTNTFTGKDRIHFEQAESGNNRDWTVKMSGDQVRAAKPGRKAAR